ncbi:hypothetical protein G655_23430 [Pseudomonas aeruginosa B136-33]|nr:hypothetical protein G655_23430 [Pseudomonas aeruginosa B136-33]
MFRYGDGSLSRFFRSPRGVELALDCTLDERHEVAEGVTDSSSCTSVPPLLDDRTTKLLGHPSERAYGLDPLLGLQSVQEILPVRMCVLACSRLYWLFT